MVRPRRVFAADANERIHLFAEKMRFRRSKNISPRPRLIEKLEKSLRQFAATLVSGRAGTGKTSIAADCANTKERRVVYGGIVRHRLECFRKLSRSERASSGRK